MNIAFGCDHAGYEEPEPYYAPTIIDHLESLGYSVQHLGTHGQGSVDYPDFANKVAHAILDGSAELGILLCGTGTGISIAANRHRGIRAAVCVTEEMVQFARAHNNANILCIGRRISSIEECKHLINSFLGTDFDGGERHVRRIDKMDELA